MLLSSSTQKHIVVGLAATLGYQGVVALYRRVRDRQASGSAGESKWVCPGIGVLGGALAASIACRAICCDAGCEAASPVVPPRHIVSDFADLLPRAVKLDPSHLSYD